MKVRGICDNITCRSENGPWFSCVPQDGNPFDNAHNMLLEVNVYAPTDGLNGTGTYHVQVKTTNQTDTAVFILNKYPLGVSNVIMTEKSIALYPNPASNLLNVFVDNKLKVKQISVYNIIGKEETILNKTDNQEVSTLNLSQYSSGIYLIRFNDANGNTVATRKFTKK